MATDGETGRIKVDAEQTQKSLDSLLATLNKLNRLTGLAFNAGSLVSYGKAAIDAGKALDKVWDSLNRGLSRQGRSFSEARSFLEDYVSDGLMPLEDAVRAYQALAERGYDDGQIRQLMASLKDIAAVGRDSNETLGETVVRAAEDLKKGSFALADNAGSAKTAADMQADYAAALGISADELSRAQAMQAEVNGIMAAASTQTGDAARTAGTYAGQISQLDYSFQSLKASIGQGLSAIAQAALPGINTVIGALVSLAGVFAQVSALLFGKKAGYTESAGAQMEIASASEAAAEGTDKLAKSTGKAGSAAKKTAKELKGVLAGFDELNILRFGDESTGGGSGGSGGGGGSAVPKVTVPKAGAVGELFAGAEVNPKLLEFVERLKAAVEPIGKTLGEGLRWFYDNALVPLGQWAVNEALPAFLDLLDGTLDGLNEAILALQPAAAWLWDKFLRPLAEWSGGAITDTLRDMGGLLRDLGETLSGKMSFGEFISGMSPLQTAIAGLAATLVTANIGGKVQELYKAFKLIKWNDLRSTLVNVGGALTELAKKSENTTGFVAKLGNAFSALKTSDTGLAQVINTEFGPLTTTISGVASIAGGAILSITNFLSMLKDGFSLTNEVLMLLGSTIAAIGAIILGVSTPVAIAVAAIAAGIATLVVVIKDHWEAVKAFFIELLESLKLTAQGFLEFLGGFFFRDVDTMVKGLKDIFNGLGGFFGTFWQGIQTVILSFLDWLDGVFGGKLYGTFAAISQMVSSTFGFIAGIFGDLWNDLKQILSGIINFIGGVFSGEWSRVWEGIKQIFAGVWNALGDIIRGAINLITTVIENFINAIIGGINLVLSGIGAVGFLFGKSINLQIEPVKLPKLANGAVIPPNRQFAAILGDQRSGTNIEAPLATIEQALQNVLSRNGGAGREINITVESMLDGKVVARNTVRHINDMTRAAGRPVLLV